MYTYVRIKSWEAGKKPVDTRCGLLMQYITKEQGKPTYNE